MEGENEKTNQSANANSGMAGDNSSKGDQTRKNDEK